VMGGARPNTPVSRLPCERTTQGMISGELFPEERKSLSLTGDPQLWSPKLSRIQYEAATFNKCIAYPRKDPALDSTLHRKRLSLLCLNGSKKQLAET